jgi:FdhD protein
MENVEEVQIERITDKGREKTDDIVTRELPLTIILNNEELVTLLCTPVNLKYLTAGYLQSEGIIGGQDEISRITVDERKGIVRLETREDRGLASDMAYKRVLTSGCGRGASFYSYADIHEGLKVESQLSVTQEELFHLLNDFQHRSDMYRDTGGVHSAAVCDREKILVFADDIGRHNAVDKVFGECLLNGILTQDRLVFTSGRISSEILVKVARRNVPILISRSAPTDLGVRLADQTGITLVGFARGHRMNIYTHNWRVISYAGRQEKDAAD